MEVFLHIFLACILIFVVITIISSVYSIHKISLSDMMCTDCRERESMECDCCPVMKNIMKNIDRVENTIDNIDVSIL